MSAGVVALVSPKGKSSFSKSSKSGYDHLDINKLYMGKSPQQVSRRETPPGMQSLGKGYPARRGGCSTAVKRESTPDDATSSSKSSTPTPLAQSQESPVEFEVAGGETEADSQSDPDNQSGADGKIQEEVTGAVGAAGESIEEPDLDSDVTEGTVGQKRKNVSTQDGPELGWMAQSGETWIERGEVSMSLLPGPHPPFAGEAILAGLLPMDFDECTGGSNLGEQTPPRPLMSLNPGAHHSPFEANRMEMHFDAGSTEFPSGDDLTSGFYPSTRPGHGVLTPPGTPPSTSSLFHDEWCSKDVDGICYLEGFCYGKPTNGLGGRSLSRQLCPQIAALQTKVLSVKRIWEPTGGDDINSSMPPQYFGNFNGGPHNQRIWEPQGPQGYALGTNLTCTPASNPEPSSCSTFQNQGMHYEQSHQLPMQSSNTAEINGRMNGSFFGGSAIPSPQDWNAFPGSSDRLRPPYVPTYRSNQNMFASPSNPTGRRMYQRFPEATPGMMDFTTGLGGLVHVPPSPSRQYVLLVRPPFCGWLPDERVPGSAVYPRRYDGDASPWPPFQHRP